MDDIKFYEKVLRKYENAENISVSKIEQQNACEKGDNFVSKVMRVTIYGTKDSHDFQTTVILKMPSDSPLTKTFKFDKIFHNEVIFYKEILHNLQRNSKYMLEPPKCLYADDFFIIEDLNKAGFQLRPKGHRFNIEETKLVLKEISKLHSASLSLEQKEPKTIKNVLQKLHPFMNKDGNDGLEKCYIDHVNVAIRLFEDMKNFDVVSILRPLKQDLYLKLLEVFEKPTEIRVFNHGDLWGNNIFFKSERIKLIDFQMIYYGSPGIDLTYFLWVNLDPVLRKENLRELLEYYVDNLRRFSIENNLSPQLVGKLTLQWIQNEMNVFSLNGLLYFFLFLPIFFVEFEKYSNESEGYENNEDKWMENMNEAYKYTLIESVLEYVNIQKEIQLLDRLAV